MRLRIIRAVLNKQIKDTFKNKEVLIQFIMFPLLAIIMEKAINSNEIPKNYFVILFSTMYIGMAPLVSMASIISEEKEQNTLRVLMMSNVKSGEYLMGIGIYVFALCMAGVAIFSSVGQFRGAEIIEFLIIMAIGILTSIFLGSAIGIWCKNQMATTSMTIPIMMIFSFLPMISMFNDKVKLISRLTYSQQVNNLINSLGEQNLNYENIVVILGNMAVMIILFTISYNLYK